MTKHRRRGTSAAGPRPRRGAPRRSRRPRGHVSEKQNIALLTRELSAALEQQAATSEVLRVIASSPDELEPVFAIILTNATQLCEGNFAARWQYDGEALVGAAQHNGSPGFAKLCRSTKLRLGREGAVRKAALERRTVHVADITVEPGFSPVVLQYENARTVLAVPLLREKNLLGVVSIWRREVQPFTEQQIALVREGSPIGVLALTRSQVEPFSDREIGLVTTFADQAVIAIENVRLFDEVQARTRELSEALEQQTATSEVLRVISSSPGELKSVFESMLSNAVRICEAKFGVLYRYDGKLFHPEALVGAPQALVEFHQKRGAFLAVPGTPLHQLWQTRNVVHTADDAGGASSSARLGGARSHLAVPLLKAHALLGSSIIYRQEVRPFTDKQVDLVTNFASQAVIAIENTRLLNR